MDGSSQYQPCTSGHVRRCERPTRSHCPIRKQIAPVSSSTPHTCIKVCPQGYFQDWALAILTHVYRVFLTIHSSTYQRFVAKQLEISNEGVLQEESINSWQAELCLSFLPTEMFVPRLRCEVIQLFIPIMCTIQPRACGTASEWRHIDRMWGPNGALAWKNTISMGKSHFADC